MSQEKKPLTMEYLNSLGQALMQMSIKDGSPMPKFGDRAGTVSVRMTNKPSSKKNNISKAKF